MNYLCDWELDVVTFSSAHLIPMQAAFPPQSSDLRVMLAYVVAHTGHSVLERTSDLCHCYTNFNYEKNACSPSIWAAALPRCVFQLSHHNPLLPEVLQSSCLLNPNICCLGVWGIRLHRYAK